jgi:putative hemolysin
MKRTGLIVVLTLALCSLVLSCGPASPSNTAEPPDTAESPTAVPTRSASLPNPAAAYCQEQGYAHQIRTAADGSQSGVCIFPNGDECDEWAFFRGECGPKQTETTVGAPGLWLDKTTFEPGEEIQVRFVAPSPLLDGAWVGIIPSDVPHGSDTTNDEYDLDYQYLEGQTAGVLIFPAPHRPGSYDFRLHDSDEDGHEVASVSFTISGGSGSPELRLDRTAFAPGEEIQVHFVAPATFPDNAWVGIIPSDVPHGDETINEEHDLDYDYLEGQGSGVLTFIAPYEPGAYDVRMHDTDDDGREVASVSFTVTGGSEKPELWLDKTTFAPGEEIQLHFATPAGFPASAWVGIIPSDVAHGSAATNDEYDLDYDYLEGRVAGVLTFFAPDEPGSYDFRLHDTDDNGVEVAFVTFRVTSN